MKAKAQPRAQDDECRCDVCALRDTIQVVMEAFVDARERSGEASPNRTINQLVRVLLSCVADISVGACVHSPMPAEQFARVLETIPAHLRREMLDSASDEPAITPPAH